MAFDQNQILKDLQQLNIAQAVAGDETRIAQPATASRNVETFFPNSPAVDVGSPGSGARVIYQATGSDGGFVGLGYPNAVACVAPQRSSQVPVAIGHGAPAVGFNYAHNLGNWVAGNAPDQPTSDMSPGFVYNANLVNRAGASPTEVSSNTSASGFGCSPNTASHAGGSGIDHASEEGGDDSSSGKKVKILCSFGGKILPRPSDGMLRYVGGQTRIISVRRDTCFNELVQRMADAYGQPVVIKYQLPNEDLDALVSVSCGDDLENMMDEYEKLVERSPDGSSKLRVFLFSASEPDSPGSVEFTDLRDSGQKYVEAVNSIGDGGIMRKESGMSASTQNSDFSVTETVDSSGVGQSDAGASQSMGISPGGNLVTHPDTSTRHLGLDPNPAIPLVSNVMQHQQQQPGVCISPSTNYMHTYVDPRQEVMSHAVLSSQMGFPNQLLGAGGSVYTQQQFHDNASGGSSQFTPGMHMTMTPSSSHVGMRPTMVQPLQTRLDCHPEESTFGARVVQLPFDQNYCTYQAQVPSTMIGGGYVLGPQTRAPDHVLFSDGLMPHQQVMIPEKVSRLEDCFMCQKSLPHAHSDVSSQDDRDSVASPISDSNVVYHSPRFEENIRPWPQNRGMAVRAVGESTVEQGATARSRVISGHQVGAARPETTGFPQNPEAQYETERIIFHKTDNLDHPGTSVPQGLMGYSGDMHSPQAQGVVMGGQQPMMPIQYQVKQEGLANKPVNTDASPIVIMPSQTSKVVVQESPKEDVINKPQQAVGREGLVDTAFSQPHMILVQPHDKTMEVILPSNTEVSHVQNILPVESSEVAGSSNIGNSDPYCPSEIGIRHLDPVETRSKVVVSGVEPNYVIDKMPRVSEWKDESSRFHPKIVLEDVESFPLDGNVTSSSSASSSVRTCGSQNVSHSLFSNQDPWNRQQDPHLFPPRLNKIESEKESFYTPFGDNNLVNGGELLGEMMLEDKALHPSGNLDKDSNSNLFGPTKSEELIRQELEATAEVIDASNFQADTPSNPDLPVQKEDDCTSETNGEEINTNASEKVNFGFPVSDGLGRLQIIRNSDLEEMQELGSGTFGTVYHGKWRGTDVAIKRINHRCFSGKASEQERMRNDFWNEAIKLADLHHPNVVAFYGVVLDSPEGSVATVTEYMVNGSLRDALERNERNLDKRKRLLIAMDVAFGMEYLHGKNIVHFDLKSDNLLVNLRDHHRPICKVGDLGLSKVKCQTLISGGVRGTLPWMAPELLNGSSSLVSDKVDVFSFGIVLWELLTGEEPYADLHYGAIIGGIVSNTLRPAIPEWCDPEWRSMMERCWASEPPDRPNFTDIANGLRSIAAKLPLKGQPHHQHQVSSPTDTHFHK